MVEGINVWWDKTFRLMKGKPKDGDIGVNIDTKSVASKKLPRIVVLGAAGKPSNSWKRRWSSVG